MLRFFLFFHITGSFTCVCSTIWLEHWHPLSFSQLSHIEAALRSHYKVRDSRDLGYGTLHMLAGLVQRQRSLAGGGLSPVYYESALFAKHCKSRLAVCYQTNCFSINFCSISYIYIYIYQFLTSNTEMTLMIFFYSTLKSSSHSHRLHYTTTYTC